MLVGVMEEKINIQRMLNAFINRKIKINIETLFRSYFLKMIETFI